MDKADMMRVVGQATNFPPVARALAFAALQKAKAADIEKISTAIESLASGQTIDAVVAGLGLAPEASTLALNFLKSNPAMLEALQSGTKAKVR